MEYKTCFQSQKYLHGQFFFLLMKLRQKKFINSHNEYLLKLKGERKISQKSRK